MATRNKWFGRNGDPSATGALDLEPVVGLRHQHLLLVPSTASPEEVTELVRARQPSGDLAADGEVIIGRNSRLSGPYELSMETAVDAAVPMPWTVVYALQAPIEREDPPLDGTDDRDGFAFAFPSGLPWREEGRGLRLLVALARRLHGAVRVAGGEIVHPDPERAVDYVVHSPYWLDPEVLAGVVGREVPGARLAIEASPWDGAHEDAYSRASLPAGPGHDPLDTDELAILHEEADAGDESALAADDVLDSFCVIGQLDPAGIDGLVEVQVHLGAPEEPSVAGQEWGKDPFVTYEVRWVCPDPGERERRLPDQHFLESRERVVPVIASVTRAVVEAVSGIVTDEDGFWVDRYAL